MSEIKFEIPELKEMTQLLKSLHDRMSKLEGKNIAAKNYYSVKEAAVYLSLSEKSVRRLIERRLLEVSRGTRHYRIMKESLDAYKEHTAG